MPLSIPSSNDLDRNSLRAMGAWHGKYRLAALGLCAECTFGGNPTDCALHELRLLPMRERVARANGLGEQRCEMLYFNHLVCSQRRIAATTRAGAPTQQAAEPEAETDNEELKSSSFLPLDLLNALACS